MNSLPFFDGSPEQAAELAGADGQPPGTGWCGLRTTGSPPSGRHVVWGRFTLLELPGVTCRPHRSAAVRVAGRVLDRHGRSYLGGSLELVTHGRPDGHPLAVAECCTAVRAVETALAASRAGPAAAAPCGDDN
jgi:hypothetical protein